VKKKQKTQRFERRKFLSAVVAAGATATVGAACKTTNETRSSGAPDIPQEGYRETAHILRYYETARL
jgi:hypothetical protein